jgi:hypothetical protein
LKNIREHGCVPIFAAPATEDLYDQRYVQVNDDDAAISLRFEYRSPA